jgi:hypothetical protein
LRVDYSPSPSGGRTGLGFSCSNKAQHTANRAQHTEAHTGNNIQKVTQAQPTQTPHIHAHEAHKSEADTRKPSVLRPCMCSISIMVLTPRPCLYPKQAPYLSHISPHPSPPSPFIHISLPPPLLSRARALSLSLSLSPAACDTDSDPLRDPLRDPYPALLRGHPYPSIY